MAIAVSIQDGELRSKLEQLIAAVANPRPVLENFHVYTMRQTDRTFRQLKHGGTFRGVTWEPFKDQYTRKTDGVTVPAWGGVPRLRAGRGSRDERGRKLKAYDINSRKQVDGSFGSTGHEENVRGRLRGRSRRVTASSHLLQDTGALRQRAGQDRVWEDGGKTLRMSTRGLVYAGKQQSMRKFLFFALPEDQEMFVKMALRYLNNLGKP